MVTSTHQTDARLARQSKLTPVSIDNMPSIKCVKRHPPGSPNVTNKVSEARKFYHQFFADNSLYLIIQSQDGMKFGDVKWEQTFKRIRKAVSYKDSGCLARS